MNSFLIEAGGYEVRKEGYLPSTVEPFVFKGGITAEMQVIMTSLVTINQHNFTCVCFALCLQRLLPSMDSPKDLYSQQKAPIPSPLIFIIRPYRPEDKVSVCCYSEIQHSYTFWLLL